MEAPATHSDREFVQVVRNAWADAEDGTILPGLPGGKPLH